MLPPGLCNGKLWTWREQTAIVYPISHLSEGKNSTSVFLCICCFSSPQVQENLHINKFRSPCSSLWFNSFICRGWCSSVHVFVSEFMALGEYAHVVYTQLKQTVLFRVFFSPSPLSVSLHPNAIPETHSITKGFLPFRSNRVPFRCWNYISEVVRVYHKFT